MTHGFHVYFGGTFDPPHIGHDEILRRLKIDPWVKRIHVVPTGVNPLKNSPESFLGTAAVRLGWVKSWIESVEPPSIAQGKIALETFEVENEERAPHYTVDTLETLRARENDGAPWVLCVGGDIPRDFHRWKRVEELFKKLHSVWVFPRGNQHDPLNEMDIKLRGLCEFRVFSESITEVSSTELRAKLRAPDAVRSLSGLPVCATIRRELEPFLKKAF